MTTQKLKEEIERIEKKLPGWRNKNQLEYLQLQVLIGELKGRQEMGMDLARYFEKIFKENKDEMQSWFYSYLEREIKKLKWRCQDGQ